MMQVYSFPTENVVRIGVKEQWSMIEMAGVDCIVNNMCADEVWALDSNDLAYTSSSGEAMQNIMFPYEYDGHEMSHLIILNDGRLVLVCHDVNSEERHYVIE